MPMRIVATLTALAVAGAIGSFVAAGCGPVTSGTEGVSCTQQSDCNTGLTCLPYLQINETDGGCAALGTVCLQKCATDEDCANVASGFTCMTACGGTPVCEPPMFYDDALVVGPGSDASSVDGANPTDAASPIDGAGPIDAQGQ
jgi:hypothetical protein